MSHLTNNQKIMTQWLGKAEAETKDTKSQGEAVMELVAYICDHKCKDRDGHNEEEMAEICESCQMNKYIKKILEG